jgi:hypothetical protein
MRRVFGPGRSKKAEGGKSEGKKGEKKTKEKHSDITVGRQGGEE